VDYAWMWACNPPRGLCFVVRSCDARCVDHAWLRDTGCVDSLHHQTIFAAWSPVSLVQHFQHLHCPRDSLAQGFLGDVCRHAQFKIAPQKNQTPPEGQRQNQRLRQKYTLN
jgi:hypothetical protein